ncbi:uncharacterized protein LACBIDRAFT_335126 [Laccaria bicolor S238N-H82]|uniref:Predicted protein n=1 Tax=Laccaria bicolor (strain S238N-H82 / ATCC MYA-4686) TaxID=486041 RepID=B0E1F9_LACBS|nr:uncharacterized protein LACBIDRAFT_335126 [Laccaria bicolor S238N-H82]EDQ99322.1 predicted protein [Laccaria bicolor S238N-H82]|eukprot:XP_001890042.1 predicted protein [Laccaria bicolor S238N-H82]
MTGIHWTPLDSDWTHSPLDWTGHSASQSGLVRGPTDVGRKAPVPRLEELPPLRKPSQPNPPPDDDSDSDNDYYPDEGDQAPPVLSVTINADISSVSVTTTPAAQITGIEPTVQAIEIQPAAIGATSGVGEATTEPASIDPNLSLPKTNQMQEDDEISWGDDEHNHDAMGPQIPPLTFTVDSEINMEAVTPADPLEFASSFLMLYGILTSEEFPVIQDMIMSIVTHLCLTVRQIFRVSADRNQSFWFEMESMEQAHQTRTHIHHKQENGIELRVAYADYEHYMEALACASHRWPDTLSNNGSQGPSSLQSVALALTMRPSREQENASPLTLRNSNADAMIHIPPLPVLPGMPAFAGLPHNALLPFGANVAFMWSPSGNTFSPVLLQGNTTVLPYPIAPTRPTPSALLPEPVATVLQYFTIPHIIHMDSTGFHWIPLDFTTYWQYPQIWTPLDSQHKTGLHWTASTKLDWTGLQITKLDWTGLHWTLPTQNWTGLDCHRAKLIQNSSSKQKKKLKYIH